MAVRVMAYVALLYQDVIRTQQFDADEGLPAVLPVVVHNGSTRWRAAEDLGSLLQSAPVGLGKPPPNIHYILVDEGSYDAAALARHDNFVASLFRLEQSRELDRVELLVSDLIEKLNRSGEESLRRAFAAWLEKVVLRRLAGECTSISGLRESGNDAVRAIRRMGSPVPSEGDAGRADEGPARGGSRTAQPTVAETFR
jgi:hypothetical protein